MFNEAAPVYKKAHSEAAQPAFTCLKLAIEILEQGVKYIQS